MSVINDTTKLYDLLKLLSSDQLSSLNSLINKEPNSYLFLNEKSKNDNDVANYISNKLNANYIKVQLLNNSIITGFTIPNTFYIVSYSNNHENIVLYKANIDNSLFLGLEKQEDENISILELRHTINEFLDGSIEGDKGISIEDFDEKLFAIEDEKVSLKNIYNENGIVSIVSEENYTIDLKDYFKVTNSSGDVLMSVDNNSIVMYKDVEVPTPTSENQAVNKSYVDTAVANASSITIRRYS